MSFPAYEEYKDSGVEWLQHVPELWQVRTISSLATKITNGYVGPTRGILVDGGVRYLQSLHIKQNEIRFNTPYYVTEEWSNEHEKSILETGDVLVVQTGDIGQVAVVPEEFAGCNCHALIILAPRREEISGEWMSWVFNSDFGFHSLMSIKTGALHPHLNCSNVKYLKIPVPPLPEQTAIASFLDTETSKIDSLVSEQRRLIELLKEKRQAVISHAVTKGLDPSVPMKESGIEWLGEVPEEWEVKKLRYFAEVLRGKFTHRPRNDPAFYDGDFPFVQTGEITGASKFITGYRQTLNERGISVSKQFPKGTLVMAIAANIGDVAILDFPAYFPDSIVGLVPNGTADVMFMYYLMQAMKQPMIQTATISTQMNLNVEQICSLSAACPPVKEQQAIAGFLDKQVETFSQLITQADRAIELLQERRTALISAAVTGKIDVREFAYQETA